VNGALGRVGAATLRQLLRAVLGAFPINSFRSRPIVPGLPDHLTSLPLNKTKRRSQGGSRPCYRRESWNPSTATRSHLSLPRKGPRRFEPTLPARVEGRIRLRTGRDVPGPSSPDAGRHLPRHGEPYRRRARHVPEAGEFAGAHSARCNASRGGITSNTAERCRLVEFGCDRTLLCLNALTLRIDAAKPPSLPAIHHQGPLFEFRSP